MNVNAYSQGKQEKMQTKANSLQVQKRVKDEERGDVKRGLM